MNNREMRIVPFLTLLVAGALAAGQANVANPRFSLALKIQKETVVAGSELRLKVVLTNTSKETISVEKSGDGFFYYDVDVRDSHGESAPDTDDGKQIKKKQFMTFYEAKIAVPPGESVEDEVSVTRLYRLAPGKYTVQLQRLDHKGKLTVKSNKISFTVTE